MLVTSLHWVTSHQSQAGTTLSADEEYGRPTVLPNLELVAVLERCVSHLARRYDDVAGEDARDLQDVGAWNVLLSGDAYNRASRSTTIAAFNS